MNNVEKTATASLALGVLASAAYVKLHYYYKDIYSRFPDLDRKIARKAYRKELRMAFSGQLTDAQMESDESMDRLFLEIVQDITNKK